MEKLRALPLSGVSRPLVSVLTPVGGYAAKFFDETARSVARAKAGMARAGMEMEAVAVLDGPPGNVPSRYLNVFDRVIPLASTWGTAGARNVALAASSGEWILPVDCDDILVTSGIVDTARQHLLSNTQPAGVGWVATSRLFLSGARTSHSFDTAEAFSAGELAERWSSPFPFHPNSVFLRRETLLAVGGWPAMRMNDDLGMMLAVSEVAGGVTHPAVTLRYRVSDGQQSADPSYVADKTAAFSVIAASVNARRTAAGRDPVVAPSPGVAYGRVEPAVTSGCYSHAENGMSQ